MAEQLHRVVVDIETTGLDPTVHVPVEIAWWDLTTGQAARFVPPHGDFDMTLAEPRALEINRYWERGLDNPSRWDDGTELARMHAALTGQTFAGANPRFDIDFIRPLFSAADLVREPWHYHVDDLAAFARGRLGLDHLPRVSEVCTLLELTPGDHTAEGDVAAEGTCFLELEQIPVAHAGAVVLDPTSVVDADRFARVAMRLPAGRSVLPGDRAYGRRALQELAAGGPS